jgi:hypothetical protein
MKFIRANGLDIGYVRPGEGSPLLFVHSAAVDSRSPLSVARQFEDAIPQAELVVIPCCGHVSNFGRPHEVNQAIRAFCRTHAEPRQPIPTLPA